MVSVYNYTNYRKFLGDYYAEQKSLHPLFSYQVLADRAGLKSKTYLHKVISGQKNLAKSSVLKVSKALKLKYNETEYFNNLVDFNNAKTVREKEYYFKKLKELAPQTNGKTILHNQFEYFSKWYYVVIRELITLKNFKDDFKLLAKAVEPAITPDQAKKAVQVLSELELIKKQSSGKYCQTDTALTTNGDTTPLAVQLFQKECLNLASQSIEQHDLDIRDISTLTVGISAVGFDQIRHEILCLRKRLVEIVKNDNPADRVYQVNFQLFPVSKVQNVD